MGRSVRSQAAAPSVLYGEPLELDRPVAATELALLLGIKLDSVLKLQARRQLPAPTWIVGGRPAWRWSEIRSWGVEAGRWSA